ncbi:MAG: energy transducer TonB [Acidobacteria bacterium]|nr:energy transducer TonB [Acidobacteriota bacterium]
MPHTPSTDLYSAREIARASGVSEARVRAILGEQRSLFVGHADAVRLGRALAQRAHAEKLFSIHFETEEALQSTPVFAVSSTVHAGMLAAFVMIATFNQAPRIASSDATSHLVDSMQLVFLATPGPGGGGGGSGFEQPAPPPKALIEGNRTVSSPVPEHQEPKPIEPTAKPLNAEPLPALIAPIVSAPADLQTRVGVLQQTDVEVDSHGPGKGGRAGSGVGSGIGDGTGSGIGPGSGGGTGGGPYRPGSGIDPPRLLREVKADYTEDARQRGLSGDVVMEIVVRRDGSVGDVKILQGLGGGLNDRAVQAVRQWRFSPAHKQGEAVDVMVEVAMEFRLR